MASLVRLSVVDQDQAWSAEDGPWFGVVLLQGADAECVAAAQGTLEFLSILDSVPDALLDPAAREHLHTRSVAPYAPRADTSSQVIFPWPAGTAMIYGPLGIHDAASRHKAADMISARESPG